MKTVGLFLIVGCVAAFTPLVAQTAPDVDKPPLPPGPILKRLPAMSQWEISYIYPDDSKKPDAGTPAVAPDAGQLVPAIFPPRKIVVTKTGSIWMAICENIKGQRIEECSPGFDRLVKFPGHDPVSLPELEQTIGAEDVNFIPSFNSTDFPGMEWLSPAYYTSVQKTKANSFYVFRDEKKDLTAWVDVATQYPIRLQHGQEMRTLRLLPPPTAKLSLPPEFQKAVKAIELVRESLGMPPRKE